MDCKSRNCTFFRTSPSTFDVSQRFIFPCHLIRSRTHSETEGKLFIKFVLHDPHNFFLLTKPKVFSSVRIKIWTHKRNLMLKCQVLQQYQTQVLQGSVRCFNKKYKSSSCGRLLLIVQLNFFWGKGCWQEEYSKQTREFTSRKRISESNIKKGCRILVRTAFLVYCILCTNLPRIIPAWKHVYFDAGFLCTTT